MRIFITLSFTDVVPNEVPQVKVYTNDTDAYAHKTEWEFHLGHVDIKEFRLTDESGDFYWKEQK